jgi:glycosyltransferase involved in cell wall biosynthesis
MKISVIIPTYNRAKFINKTLDAVFNQSFKVDEIIVIDDGSTDDTKEALQNFPIKYTYQKNSGVSSARNTGIKEAKNQWICFLDSDDIWDRDKIKEQIEFHLQYLDEFLFDTYYKELVSISNFLAISSSEIYSDFGISFLFCTVSKISLCSIFSIKFSISFNLSYSPVEITTASSLLFFKTPTFSKVLSLISTSTLLSDFVKSVIDSSSFCV